MTLDEVRQKYPQYNDLSDEQLLQGLHQKYYSDMPYDEFSSNFTQSQPKAETTGIGSAIEGIGQGLSMGWIDEIASGLAATVKAPFVNKTWQEIYKDQLDKERANLQAAKTEHPYVTGTGEVAGAIASGMAMPGIRSAKTIGGAVAKGATQGAVAGGIYGAGTANEDKLIEGAKGAGVGAVLGGAIGGVAGALARPKSPVPGLDELRAKADQAYQAAENSGVAIKPQRFSQVVSDIKNKAIQEGLDPTLHPGATAALKRLEDSASQGLPQTFKGAETLRKILKGAASSNSKDERRIAYIITDKYDDFIRNLNPSDVVSGDTTVARESIKTARDLWTRMSKGEVVETLMERAANRSSQFSGSGYENALRTEFRSLIQNPKRFRVFNKAEQEALKKVARGGPIENALRMIGKAAPTGIVSGSLGAGAGFAVGGPMGAAAVPLAGAAARIGATQMTKNNALIASQLMRGGQNAFLNPNTLQYASPAITGSIPLIYKDLENQ